MNATGFFEPRIARSLRVLFPYIPVALFLLVTVFYHGNLKRRFGDAKGVWLYFFLFFLLLVLIPAALVVVLEPQPLRFLSGLGVRLGNYKLGFLLTLCWLPICGALAYFTSKNPEMKEFYPFSKTACAGGGSFLLYEAGYFLLYYTAWEFLYRGVLFVPLLRFLGALPAISVTAALSILHHIGHPRTEILGALLGGFIFGGVALVTRSLLYPIAFHAILGVAVDTFLYFRNHRRLRPVR